MIERPDYFDDIKNYINITWSDTELENRLTGICKRAESFLQKRAGKTIEFSRQMEDQGLLQILYDCVWYIQNASLDEFEKNYESDLWAMRANAHIEMGEQDEKEIPFDIQRRNCHCVQGMHSTVKLWRKEKC